MPPSHTYRCSSALEPAGASGLTGEGGRLGAGGEGVLRLAVARRAVLARVGRWRQDGWQADESDAPVRAHVVVAAAMEG